MRDRATVTIPVNRITTVVLDIVAPLTLVYGLRAVGVGDVPVLVASAIPPTVNLAVTTARRRRIDALAVAVLVGTALGVAAVLLGGGPRELLARGRGSAHRPGCGRSPPCCDRNRSAMR